MKNVMKLSFFAVVALCLSLMSFRMAEAPLPPNGGSIVVEGESLISTSNDPTLQITNIHLSGPATDNIPGCGEFKCADDISKYPNGMYFVTVRLNNGSEFSGWVEFR